MASIGTLEIGDLEFNVVSYSFAPQHAQAAATGTGGSSKASIHDISLTILVNSDTPLLVQYAATGQGFDNATMYIYRGDPDEPGATLYLTIEFTNVVVSAVHYGAKGEKPGIFMAALNFDSMNQNFS